MHECCRASRTRRARRARGARKPQNAGMTPAPGGHATPRGFNRSAVVFCLCLGASWGRGGGGRVICVFWLFALCRWGRFCWDEPQNTFFFSFCFTSSSFFPYIYRAFETYSCFRKSRSRLDSTRFINEFFFMMSHTSFLFPLALGNRAEWARGWKTRNKWIQV